MESLGTGWLGSLMLTWTSTWCGDAHRRLEECFGEMTDSGIRDLKLAMLESVSQLRKGQLMRALTVCSVCLNEGMRT